MFYSWTLIRIGSLVLSYCLKADREAVRTLERRSFPIFITKRKSNKGGSLENGREDVGGGAGEREIIWKKRASVIEREREKEREREREEEERRTRAQYTVWRLREGFQERKDREGDRGKGKSAEGGREAQPEVIWKRREEEEEEKERERIQLDDRGPRIIWRKKERE